MGSTSLLFFTAVAVSCIFEIRAAPRVYPVNRLGTSSSTTSNEAPSTNNNNEVPAVTVIVNNDNNEDTSTLNDKNGAPVVADNKKNNNKIYSETSNSNNNRVPSETIIVNNNNRVPAETIIVNNNGVTAIGSGKNKDKNGDKVPSVVTNTNYKIPVDTNNINNNKNGRPSLINTENNKNSNSKIPTVLYTKPDKYTEIPPLPESTSTANKKPNRNEIPITWNENEDSKVKVGHSKTGSSYSEVYSENANNLESPFFPQTTNTGNRKAKVTSIVTSTNNRVPAETNGRPMPTNTDNNNGRIPVGLQLVSSGHYTDVLPESINSANKKPNRVEIPITWIDNEDNKVKVGHSANGFSNSAVVGYTVESSRGVDKKGRCEEDWKIKTAQFEDTYEIPCSDEPTPVINKGDFLIIGDPKKTPVTLYSDDPSVIVTIKKGKCKRRTYRLKHEKIKRHSDEMDKNECFNLKQLIETKTQQNSEKPNSKWNELNKEDEVFQSFPEIFGSMDNLKKRNQQHWDEVNKKHEEILQSMMSELPGRKNDGKENIGNNWDEWNKKPEGMRQPMTPQFSGGMFDDTDHHKDWDQWNKHFDNHMDFPPSFNFD